MYKTRFPIVLHGCKSYYLTVREEHGFRVLRRIFEPKMDEMTGSWRNIHNDSSIAHILHQILLRLSYQERLDGWDM